MNDTIQETLAQASELLKVNVVPSGEVGADLPVRVALFCQPQQNPFGILHELFGGLAPLNRALFSGFHCVITSGDGPNFFLTDSGERAPITGEELAEKLSGFESSLALTACEIELANPALKNVELHVIASGEDYEDIDWLEEITKFDSAMFVLSATALLSMAERKALRPLLRDAKEALSIVLVNNNLVLDEDRGDIDSMLNNFLKGRVDAYHLPAESAAELRGMIGALSQRLDELRKLRARRVGIVALRRACEAADARLAALNAEDDRLEELLQVLNEKVLALPNRQEAACRRARMRFISGMRVDLTARLSRFHQDLLEKLQSEIENDEDVEGLGDILPGYISSQWNNAIEQIGEQMRSMTQEMTEELQDYLDKDIREYLADGVDTELVKTMFGAAEMYYGDILKAQINEGRFHAEPIQESTTSFASFSTIKTAVGLCLLVAVNPLMGIAIGALSGAAVLKHRKHERIEKSREAYLKASKEMCTEIYDESIKMLDTACSALGHSLNQNVESCYQKVMEGMVQAISARRQDRSDRKEQTDATMELKRQLEKLLQE